MLVLFLIAVLCSAIKKRTSIAIKTAKGFFVSSLLFIGAPFLPSPFGGGEGIKGAATSGSYF
jgi:hypothetical protein